jgi:hypothetical protein
MSRQWSEEGEYLSSLGPNGEEPEKPAKKPRKKKAAKPVEGHTALSSSQMEAAKELEAKKFPESDGGIPCRVPGCNTWITGTLDDVVAHRATHA